MYRFIFLLAVVVSCADKKELSENTADKSEISAEDSLTMVDIHSLSKIVEAKVIYVPFVNKAGKLIEGVGDYFLVYDNQQWFIKSFSSPELKSEIEKLQDKTAKFSVTEREGLWDTDDPNVQSRIGKYVIVHRIIKE